MIQLVDLAKCLNRIQLIRKYNLPADYWPEDLPANNAHQDPQHEVGTKLLERPRLTGGIVGPEPEQNCDDIDHPEKYR